MKTLKQKEEFCEAVEKKLKSQFQNLGYGSKCYEEYVDNNGEFEISKFHTKSNNPEIIN